MSWLGGLRTRVRLLLSSRDAENRMDEEFRFHLEMETEEGVRQGLDAREARRQALIAFGGVERHKEKMRDERGGRWMNDLLQDLRLAGRNAARDRGFTLVAALIIAIGIGATTVVFTLANAILLRPLPLPEVGRLFVLTESRVGAVRQGSDGTALPYARYVAYRDATTSVFSGLAGHLTTSLSLRTGDETSSVRGELTSGNYFDVLGVHPSLGRSFASDSDEGVVLSDATWRNRFGADPAVIGRTIWLDGLSLPILGVAREGFQGTNPTQRVDVWVPLVTARKAQGLTSMASWLFLFGRLAPGATEAHADAVVDAVAMRVPPDEPQSRVRGARLEPMNGLFRGASRRALKILFAMLLGAALLVLLIASANVAGMLSARGLARQREVSIRRAMGAGRGRLIRQLLAESALLALIGGVGGVVIAAASGRLASDVLTSLFGWRLPLDVSPDLRVLAFALALASATVLLSGLLPAVQTSRTDMTSTLKDGGWGGSTRGASTRNAFVAGQLAVAVFLVVLSGLFVRSFQRISDVDLGADPDDLVVATVDVGPRGYDEVRGRAFYHALQERVGVMAGVRSVALAGASLLGGDIGGNDMSNGESGNDEQRAYGVSQNRVDTAFFSTVRLPLVAGRGFTSDDGPGAPLVTVVNEALARRFWPGEQAVGRYVHTMGEEMRVVGVVQDGLYALRGSLPAEYAFFPFAQWYSGSMTLQVRLRSGARAADVIQGIRREVRALDPDVAVENATLLSEPITRLLAPQRALAALLSLLGLVGLLLSGAGVYGTLSFQVAQRAREFGIRVALGASRPSVMGAALARGALLGGVGGAVGLALGGAASLVLRTFLYGVGAFDPVTFVTATAILVTVAVLASALPAHRATRVDPVEVLRTE